MHPRSLTGFRCMQRTILFIFCLLSMAAVITGQNPEEPFRFGNVDMELLDQVKQIDKNFEDRGLVYRDAEMNAYLNRLGNSLIKGENQPENVVWQFRILRDPSVNAFALPSGSIYVHTGLMARMENESQLAAVLAHEIIHVSNRHSYKAYRSYRKKTLAINLISLAGSFAGMDGLGLAAQFILNISLIGYSRELEKEADLDGARLLLASPELDAQATVGAFESLLNTYDVDLVGEPFYGDHPKIKDRIAYMREFLARNSEKEATEGNLNKHTNKEKYQLDIAVVTQHNVYLAIDEGLYRTAVILGKRLIDVQPNAANITALADAYAALGPRPLEPTDEEKSKKGKGEAKKRSKKMTLQETERLLASTSTGQELQKANYAEAEKQYRSALDKDANFALAWRGLGTLFEKRDQPQNAVDAYRKYIELQPGAMDRLMIMRRIKNLEAKTAPADQKQL